MSVFDGLTSPGAVGQNILASFEHGQQVGRENQARNAMAQYAMNPNDPKAYEALAQANPQMAMQARGQQQQQALAAVEQHKEAILAGAKIFRSLGVKDEASYQQALGLARQYGIPLDDVPPNYDPQYVEGITHLADAFDPQKAQGGPNIQKEVDYYRSIGREDLAQQLLVNHANPQIGVNNGNGTYTLMRPPLQGGSETPHVLTDDDIRQMEGGQPGQPSADGFLR